MAGSEGQNRDAPISGGFRDQLGRSKGKLLCPPGDAERLLDAVQWSRRKFGHAEQLIVLAVEIERPSLS